MKNVSAALVVALLFIVPGSLLAAQTQPAQPQDPTQQSPTTHAPAPSSRPRPLPDETSPGGSGGSSPTTPAHLKGRPFMGTIVKRPAGYFLRAGDLEYKLEDAAEVRRYEGKSVKVLGNLEKQSNTIHVQSIEPSPSS